MSVYRYPARDATGHEFHSVYTNVESVDALREDLGKLGYRLVRARRQSELSGPWGPGNPELGPRWALWAGGASTRWPFAFRHRCPASSVP